MIERILIANRGEIACRIIKTAKRLGFQTVAIYSNSDRYSQHVLNADHAVHIGSSSPSESYLNMVNIIHAAKLLNCSAIHPGYGFLSENYQFAKLCSDNSLTWIGPPSACIYAMGNKDISKQLMNDAGVSTIPGFHNDSHNDDYLKLMAEQIGYPLLIKAVSGGGGKGMRVVNNPIDFISSLISCRSEAKNFFSNSRVILEKYIQSPRHVEVQILADKFGNTIHLFERDCSIQRRHQKIIEEAPAPNISSKVKNSLYEQAILAAKRVNYIGAGTVEFILDKNHNFYFMEMNTRLQVEHPLTEMITDLDLVELQLKIAFGDSIKSLLSQIQIKGHAIEARIYAEDIINNFAPSPGYLKVFQSPSISSNIRIDSGVVVGDEITSYYDSLLAKLIVWGENREEAMRILFRKLREFRVTGLSTNIELLSRIISHRSFVNCEFNTHFIENYKSDLISNLSNLSSNDSILISSIFALVLYELSKKDKFSSVYNFSPFCVKGSATFLPISYKKFNILFDNYPLIAIVNFTSYPRLLIDLINPENNNYIFQNVYCEGKLHSQRDSNNIILYSLINCRLEKADIIIENKTVNIFFADVSHKIQLIPPKYLQKKRILTSKNVIMSQPFSSTLTKLYTTEGSKIQATQPILTLSAMKQEHNIVAPMDGYVEKIYFQVGSIIPANSIIIKIKMD